MHAATEYLSWLSLIYGISTRLPIWPTIGMPLSLNGSFSMAGDGRHQAGRKAGSIHSKQDRMSWGNDDAGIVAAFDRLLGDRRRHICLGGRKTDSPAYIALQYKKIMLQDARLQGCESAAALPMRPAGIGS
ncbi:MAG: hypothetical protein A3J24_02440 [Deltaproteobacteria bacterium RIFCSPLOWO2_02_FULL_53_8]|nr:MAG: hypothetical protein A3J24_02440 [Deltaproteobacteria bacterium RIFCSPLOWO2_02_FULL_53_8]